MPNEQQQDKPDSTDRMQFAFLGVSFSVSGRNASKFFWAAGAIGIILALGWAIANIVGAFRDVPTHTTNPIPSDTAYYFRRRNPVDLPRRLDWQSEAA